MLTRYENTGRDGFVLIEVLIAVAILSVVLLSVYSGISSGINIIGNSKNDTNSIIIAKSLMNDFRNNNMRGPDLHDVDVENYPGFTYDRISTRYEQPFFGPMIINQTKITVKWRYKGILNNYDLLMIYQVK